MEVPVGPQHPALKEPIRLTLYIDGEYVVRVKPRIGYVHRAIEKAFEQRNYIQNLYLAERVCGICSHSHIFCYSQCLDRLLEKPAPPRGEYIRLIVAELERIHSHLLWLGVAFHEIGFDTLWYYVWRDREVVMDLLELVSGNRVNYAMSTVGGARRDIDNLKADKIRKGMNVLEERTKYYLDVCIKDIVSGTSVRRRTEGVAILKTRDAIELGAVGPTARASNVKRDIRADDKYSAYAECWERSGVDVIVWETCDLWARVAVRVLEVIQSIQLIRDALDHMPSGPYRHPLPPVLRIPENEAISMVEAPRGELIHHIRSDGTDRPYRHKVRSPTLGNILPVCKMLEGVYIADVPIAFAGIDPCISCTDRVLHLIDVGRREPRDLGVFNIFELRHWARKRCGGSR